MFYPFWISAKLAYILLDPAQSLDLVEQAVVSASLLRIRHQEAESIEPKGEKDKIVLVEK